MEHEHQANCRRIAERLDPGQETDLWAFYWEGPEDQDQFHMVRDLAERDGIVVLIEQLYAKLEAKDAGRVLQSFFFSRLFITREGRVKAVARAVEALESSSLRN